LVNTGYSGNLQLVTNRVASMNATHFSKTPLGRALLQVASLRRRPVILLTGLMRNFREWRPPSAPAIVVEPKSNTPWTELKVRKSPRPPLPITPTVPAHVAPTKPSEHQSETEFLRHCLQYGDRSGHQALGNRIAQMQRDVRCVQRAVWLMAVLTALAATGLAYVAVLGGGIPADVSRLIVNGVSALGLAAVISLAAFVGLLVVFRMNLNEQREEGRQRVTELLASRLGKPAILPWNASGVGGGNGKTVSISAGSVVEPER
jgi:hypothetical protein